MIKIQTSISGLEITFLVLNWGAFVAQAWPQMGLNMQTLAYGVKVCVQMDGFVV